LIKYWPPSSTASAFAKCRTGQGNISNVQPRYLEITKIIKSPITMNTDFGQAIGNINIIPQDIGRVLLNLYNNAFMLLLRK